MRALNYNHPRSPFQNYTAHPDKNLLDRPTDRAANEHEFLFPPEAPRKEKERERESEQWQKRKGKTEKSGEFYGAHTIRQPRGRTFSFACASLISSSSRQQQQRAPALIIRRIDPFAAPRAAAARNLISLPRTSSSAEEEGKKEIKNRA